MHKLRDSKSVVPAACHRGHGVSVWGNQWNVIFQLALIS